MRVRKLVFLTVAGLRRLVDVDSAWVGIAHSARRLVEGFACGVVDSLTYRFELRPVVDLHNMAVRPGGHQAEVRRFKLRVSQVIRRDVPANVVHRDKRLIQRQRKPLRKVDSYKQRADKPRCVAYGYRVDILRFHARLLERLVNYRDYALAVAAAGYLGDYAAVQLVLLYLRCHD